MSWARVAISWRPLPCSVNGKTVVRERAPFSAAFYASQSRWSCLLCVHGTPTRTWIHGDWWKHQKSSIPHIREKFFSYILLKKKKKWQLSTSWGGWGGVVVCFLGFLFVFFFLEGIWMILEGSLINSFWKRSHHRDICHGLTRQPATKNQTAARSPLPVPPSAVGRRNRQKVKPVGWEKEFN